MTYPFLYPRKGKYQRHKIRAVERTRRSIKYNTWSNPPPIIQDTRINYLETLGLHYDVPCHHKTIGAGFSFVADAGRYTSI
jgi:hypothetical protein